MSDEIYPTDGSLAYCLCNTCSGRVEFDASLLQAGTMVVCPHCGMETAIYIQKKKLAADVKKSSQVENLSQERLQAIDSLTIVGGTDCPSCGSTQTQRLEMTFSMGISSSRGMAIGTDLDGDIGIASYGGKSQTALSSASQPPKQKSGSGTDIGGLIIGVMLVFFVIILCFMFDESMTPLVFLGLIILFIGYFIGFMKWSHKVNAPIRRYNTQVYPLLMARWRAAWICLRCGKRWIPEK